MENQGLHISAIRRCRTEEDDTLKKSRRGRCIVEGRRFWRRKYYQTVNDCEFFDWVEQDGKDIVIGRLRMKIATLKGTVRRLQRVKKVLLVSTVFLVVALATIMFFILVLYFIGDLTGVVWDEATAGWVGGGADEVPKGWEGAGCGVDEAPTGWEGDGSGAYDVPAGHFSDDLGHFCRLWPFFPQSLHFCVWHVLLTSSGIKSSGFLLMKCIADTTSQHGIPTYYSIAHRNVVLSGIDSCSNALEEFGSSVYKLLHPQPSFLALFSPILLDGEHKTSAQHWEAAHLLQVADPVRRTKTVP
ncbi:uncharacterized protein G2W53_041932 [Senna tora]|uniref:Uncharacterized protein n=1 Tax=Senna tora TaxID=362788 RepID=A0A834W1W5_9FABA|nr:uncharacterized protein G2W53_041932 [Senna tora]